MRRRRSRPARRGVGLSGRLGVSAAPVDRCDPDPTESPGPGQAPPPDENRTLAVR